MGEGGEWPGKVVFVTGVARGQGRSHALEFARHGADVGGLDLCAPIATVPYALADPSDLEQTAAEIRSLGGRAVLEVGDVRDPARVRAVVARVLDSFGRIDVVVTNAGVFSVGDPLTLSPETWRDVLDVNLTGVWNTVQACLPAMVEGGRGGSIVMTSSIGGVQGLLECPHYVASKHGVIGLMRALANELARYHIRVNAVCPTNVNTPMIQNPANYRTFRPDLEDPRSEDIVDVARAMHLLDVPWVEPEDVTAAVVWLASDAARYLTGVALPVDAGLLEKVQN
jgi:(+)-trans-carveol dehydrogenase